MAGDAGRGLYQADLQGSLALVLGGEDRGVRPATRKRCDDVVRLPLQGRTESLNVSVAAGVCLFEAVRQRGSQ
jgi:23S rRNA (guanosine2251-2'-O)-methyltransferase